MFGLDYIYLIVISSSSWEWVEQKYLFLARMLCLLLPLDWCGMFCKCNHMFKYKTRDEVARVCVWGGGVILSKDIRRATREKQQQYSIKNAHGKKYALDA